MTTVPAAPFMILHDTPAREAHGQLRAHVSAATRDLWGERGGRPLTVIKSGTHGFIGAACGIVCPGWLCLELMWVEETNRRQGIGAALLQQIEQQALALGAHSAYLWTQEFEAPAFYHRHGYSDFATLEEFGPGHQLIGMRKRLNAG